MIIRSCFLHDSFVSLGSGPTIGLASLAGRGAQRVGAEELTGFLGDTVPLRSIAAACPFRLELAGCGKMPPVAFPALPNRFCEAGRIPQRLKVRHRV